MKLYLRITATLLLVSACGKQPSQVSQEVAIPSVETAGERDIQEVSIVDYPRVVLSTDAGNVVIELYEDKAPLTVRHFMSYVEANHYDNTVFHRVIGNLLVQGGAYTADYRLKPDRGLIRSESNNGLRNLRGTVAAARRANEPDSAGAQFFINVVDNPQFDFVATTDAQSQGYTVFGRVVEGMEVIDGLRAVKVAPRAGIGDATPIKPIIIRQIRSAETP
ncbi:peptidylprolyl isomerase [Arenimonas sp.]|jgi:cyclophilin family peptidyl-prolyl cis-trans isomerase|uniref:peptidylprolyl isomerase n=1 Tax=Arenimonas sp. TaxID=1872635 RepID=UPI0037BF6E5B